MFERLFYPERPTFRLKVIRKFCALFFCFVLFLFKDSQHLLKSFMSFELIYYLLQSLEVDDVKSPILQIKKLRPR